MQEIFNLPPLNDIIPNETNISPNKSIVPQENVDLNDDLKQAYQQTKDNLQDLIDSGKDALEEILQIAKEGQHPRAFEVAGALLKNVVDANKELLNVQKQMREMENAGKKTGATNIDKAVFVGSPQDLNKLLRGEEL